MFDIGFSEMMVIGVVALIVLGPEKLPRVAKTIGHLMGRMQRYVNDVKSDINREIELDELRKFKQEVETTAQTFKSEVDQTMQSFESTVRDATGGVTGAVSDLTSSVTSSVTGSAQQVLGDISSAATSTASASSADASAAATTPAKPVV